MKKEVVAMGQVNLATGDAALCVHDRVSQFVLAMDSWSTIDPSTPENDLVSPRSLIHALYVHWDVIESLVVLGRDFPSFDQAQVIEVITRRAPGKGIEECEADGVGLLNYAKLLECSRSPCSFWLMPDWPALVKTFGSNVIWQNTQADFQTAFARLKAAGAPEEVIELCVALSSQGLALEHESVWLCIPSPVGET